MRSDDLRQVEPFRDLDDHALARLAQDFVEIHLPADYPVFREGAPVDSFYVVKEGRVVVYRDTVGKPVQLLARVGACEFFGEFALFTQCESTISARTTEPSRLLKIDKSVLLDFLEAQPVVALKLEMAAAKRHTINAAAALELGQRNEVRIRVSRRVRLTLDDGSSHPVVIDNLSSGGLSLRGAPETWTEGDVVAFDLHLNPEVLPCEGRVAWVRGDLVGLAFTDCSEDHDALVQRSLRHLLRSPRPG
ncbi:MAG TPA: cyclic nucleotide-binding domain-containing protein [Thermoanaerobaculia bacterium]|jgi:CRP-like cAMP-binding protein